LHRFTALPQIVQTTGGAKAPGDPSTTYMTLHGHTDVINSVEFSRDGQYVVTASYDRTVRIWDTRTYSQVGDALAGHTDAVWSACFSPDGTLVVSGSADHTVRIWNAQSQGHEQIGESFDGHPHVRKVTFLANEKQVVSASSSIILLWDAVTHVQIAEPLYYRGYAFAISPDGNCIAVCTEDDTCLEIRDIQTGVQVGQRLSGHNGRLLSVVFSPDGQRIVTSARDKPAYRVWDANTGAPIDVINGPHFTAHISFFPDGRHIMARKAGYQIQPRTEFWDLKTHSQIRQDLSSKINNFAIFSSLSPDGNQLASISKNLHSIRIQSLEAPVDNSTSTGAFEMKSALYSPDGKSIITACSDKSIRTWDAQTYSQTGNTLRGHRNPVDGAVFSPDGNLIVSVSADKTVRVWSAETGTQICGPLIGHMEDVSLAVAFSPDGTCFASTDGSTIRVWNAGRSDLGKLMQAFEIPHPRRGRVLPSISFSSQGQFIAVNVESLWDTDTYVLDLKTGTESSVIPSQYQHSSICFSPDEHLMLFFGGTDYRLHLWNVEAYCTEKVFRGHTSTVRKASFSSGGKHIVSASMDHTIRVWDTRTGSQTAKYLSLGRLHNTDCLKTIEVSPNGRHILSVYSHHTQIWVMPDSLPPETNLDYSIDDPNVRL